ncbi:beta strand repeat-containing protein [Verrucomicrobiota bacterium sgz303538]
MRILPVSCLILASSIATLSAELYTSAGSGLWDATNVGTWNPAGNPQTGSTDSVTILTGHTVNFSGANGVGLSGSGDLGVANGQTININGGILTQTPPNFWIRIGHETDGTLNINDGRFHFTNSTATAAPNLQIGIRGASGFVNIGDGIGEPGSAVLNLRDIVDGTANGANVSLNLAATEGSFANGVAGTIVIKSDGLLEGDVRNTSANNPVIRVGQAGSSSQSSIIVNAGGQFRAHGTVEIGSNAGANGLIRINGNGARMDMDGGEFDIGWNGTGAFVLENGGVYSRVDTAAERLDMLVGREATGIGSVEIKSGAQLLRGAGSNVGDMRIGLRGTGTMTISDGGLMQNDSGNWDWVGQESGGNGTLTINTDGTFRTTGGSNLIIGVNAGSTGLVVVNGGMLDLQSTSSADVRVAQNGTGTFKQISGISNVRWMQFAENNGTAFFDLRGGDLNVRSSFFLGGASATSTGTGTATATQSGGNLTAGGAFVVGLATGHTASYTMTGGTIRHTSSDMSVGESGIGTMRIGVGATVDDVSTSGRFFVGRNEGSSGSLFVDGTLTRLASNDIRVGNGDANDVDNTTAPGLLGGTGSIVSGVRIGAHGTLTGGDLGTVGTLTLTGNLSFSANGTLFADFGTTGNADRIKIFGSVDLTGAVLDGDWLGGVVGLASRYWLIDNDDVDPILGTFANVSLTSPNSSLFPSADGWATIDGQEFAVFYNADFDKNALTGGNDLLLAAIPEPSASLLLGCGLALTFARRRRKNA